MAKDVTLQVEAITFDQLVEFAKANSNEPHWSFNYKGHPISHENDSCYIVPTSNGLKHFTPGMMLYSVFDQLFIVELK